MMTEPCFPIKSVHNLFNNINISSQQLLLDYRILTLNQSYKSNLISSQYLLQIVKETSMSQQIIVDQFPKSKSSDHWACPNCSFQNTALLPNCQICEGARPKSENQLKRDQIKEIKGFKCHKCAIITEILKNKCENCGEILIPQDSEQQQQIVPTIKKKEEKKQLKACPYCSFENDPLNQECVSCENSLNEIGQIPSRSLFAGKIKKSRYDQIKCLHCPMVAKKRFMSNHMKSCPGKINKTVSYQQIKRRYCLFCYDKFDSEIADIHQQTCPKRQQFFEVKDNPTFDRLSKLQIDTMEYMHKKSEKLHWIAENSFLTRVKSLGFNESDLENLHHYIVNYAPIIIHMHANNHMQFFVKDTHYRNQFQTRKSSGSLSSSARTNWEDRMFDAKHHSATPFERVKYGTINFTNDPKGVGVCSGYGQSYFLLKPHVRNRCTVTDMDSSSPSAAIGTFQFCYHVLNKISDAEIRAAFQGSKGNEVGSEVIGSYKQIQIHGPVEFKKDIERVYISRHQLTDPSVEKMIKDFCNNNDLQYEIFEKVMPGMVAGMTGMAGLAGSGLFGFPHLTVPTVAYRGKPKKTKTTSHLFGGGSALPYSVAPPPRIIPDSPRIIPDPPRVIPVLFPPPQPVVDYFEQFPEYQQLQYEDEDDYDGQDGVDYI